MISWHKYFVYLSLFFLAVFLFKTDYLKIPAVISPQYLILSFLFLFSGFIGNAFSWHRLLKASKNPVSIKVCISSVGLSIFGKYIPGKFWLIMGRAAHVAENSAYSLGRVSALSLNAQFISLWFGLVLGTFGLFILGGLYLWGWIILVLWLVLTAVVFSSFFNNAGEKFLSFILKKEIAIPKLTLMETITVAPWFAISWLLWAAGFYFFVCALSLSGMPISVGLGFPLAGTLGIMAVFAPGGLGAREGVAAAYLCLAGLGLQEATTIAVASRAWFLSGEAFIFLLGWFSKKAHRKIQ